MKQSCAIDPHPHPTPVDTTYPQRVPNPDEHSTAIEQGYQQLAQYHDQYWLGNARTPISSPTEPV